MKFSLWQPIALLCLVAVLVFSSAFAAAQIETILHPFAGTPDASLANALVMGSDGNLYGVSTQGGASGNYGTVFQLKRNSSGGWDETIIYSFQGGSDGRNPSSLIADTSGNFYGTAGGGSSDGGTVFQLRQVQGVWKKKVLYRFNASTIGSSPTGIVFDNAGNIFGVLGLGGPTGYGGVFKLTPSGSGTWTLKLIYTLKNQKDGTGPEAVVVDPAGNVYGTIYIGLSHHGLVYKLTPGASGSYTFSVIHRFPNNGGPDGEYPRGRIVLDAQGNLYGTTSGGGSSFAWGMVYQLVPNADGTWTENILHNFLNGSDGSYPLNGVTLDTQGNVYGVTYYGGGLSQCGSGGTETCGTAYKLSPDGQGGWTETILHAFAGFKVDGTDPFSELVQDSAGALYGLTSYGGGAGVCHVNPTFNSYCGIVFSIQP